MRKAALVAVVAAASGCGGEKVGYAPAGATGAERLGPARDSARVDMKAIKFSPATVRVRRGAVVEWVNRDRVAHTVVDGSDVYNEFHSGEIPTGKTYRRRFAQAGEVGYQCTIHANMDGRIVVER